MCVSRKSDGGRGDGCKGQKGQWEAGQLTCWNTDKSQNHWNQSKEQRLEFVATFSLNLLFAYITTVTYVCLGAVGQDVGVHPFPPPFLSLCYSACHRSFSLACLLVASSLLLCCRLVGALFLPLKIFNIQIVQRGCQTCGCHSSSCSGIFPCPSSPLLS